MRSTRDAVPSNSVLEVHVMLMQMFISLLMRYQSTPNNSTFDRHIPDNMHELQTRTVQRCQQFGALLPRPGHTATECKTSAEGSEWRAESN